MATVNQLVRKPRARKVTKSNVSALEVCLQRRDVYTRIYTATPKRPNSALRKVYRVCLTNGFEVISYIGGKGHNPQKHSMIPVYSGHVKDLPGVHYHAVHGALDCSGVKDHKQARPKYDVKHPKA